MAERIPRGRTKGWLRAAAAGGLMAWTGMAAAEPPGPVLELDATKLWNPGLLSVWKDSSGHGNDVSQKSHDKQPTFDQNFHNHQPAVVFREGEYLDGPAVLPAGAKALTYVAVWQRTKTGDNESIIEQAAKGRGRRAALLTVGARYGFDGEGNDQDELMPFEADRFAVSVLRLEPDGNVTLFHNGHANSGPIDMAKENLGADGLRIGGKIYGGAEAFTGAMEEIRVYDRAVTDAEALAITAELVKKWMIEVEATPPKKASVNETTTK